MSRPGRGRRGPEPWACVPGEPRPLGHVPYRTVLAPAASPSDPPGSSRRARVPSATSRQQRPGPQACLPGGPGPLGHVPPGRPRPPTMMCLGPLGCTSRRVPARQGPAAGDSAGSSPRQGSSPRPWWPLSLSPGLPCGQGDDGPVRQWFRAQGNGRGTALGRGERSVHPLPTGHRWPWF